MLSISKRDFKNEEIECIIDICVDHKVISKEKK